MTHYRVHLFGEIKIVAAESGEILDLPGKGMELLFFLLLHADAPHHRELLMTQLWPDVSADCASKYLRQVLWQIQSKMNDCNDGELFEKTQGRWLRLNPNITIWTDFDQLTTTFAGLRSINGADMVQNQFEIARKSTAYYRGDLLPGWYQTWCLIERERYRSIFLALVDRLMGYCLANGRYDEGVQYGHTLLRHDITREKTYRGLMRLYSLSGDRSSALRQYEQCRFILNHELQVQPSLATEQLYNQILDDNIIQPAAINARPAAGASPSERADTRLLSELEQIKTFLHQIKGELDDLKLRLQTEV